MICLISPLWFQKNFSKYPAVSASYMNMISRFPPKSKSSLNQWMIWLCCSKRTAIENHHASYWTNTYGVWPGINEFMRDCSLSLPAGHKLFTCSHNACTCHVTYHLHLRVECDFLFVLFRMYLLPRMRECRSVSQFGNSFLSALSTILCISLRVSFVTVVKSRRLALCANGR